MKMFNFLNKTLIDLDFGGVILSARLVDIKLPFNLFTLHVMKILIL